LFQDSQPKVDSEIDNGEADTEEMNSEPVNDAENSSELCDRLIEEDSNDTADNGIKDSEGVVSETVDDGVNEALVGDTDSRPNQASKKKVPKKPDPSQKIVSTLLMFNVYTSFSLCK